MGCLSKGLFFPLSFPNLFLSKEHQMKNNNVMGWRMWGVIQLNGFFNGYITFTVVCIYYTWSHGGGFVSKYLLCHQKTFYTFWGEKWWSLSCVVLNYTKIIKRLKENPEVGLTEQFFLSFLQKKTWMNLSRMKRVRKMMGMKTMKRKMDENWVGDEIKKVASKIGKPNR